MLYPYELLSFEGILLTDSHKMLRCKGRDRLELELFLWRANRITDSEDTRVKHTDYISCIGFVDYLSFLSHYLLRLRKSELFIALNMENFHILIELA